MEKTVGYAPINGLRMYYEIAGDGPPLVLLRRLLAVADVDAVRALTRSRRVIAVDLQGHGRTADLVERPMSLQQSAKDVIALLGHLAIENADFLGESYGGASALLVALERPELVRRVATYGATFGPAADAHALEMVDFTEPPTADSRCFRLQQDEYRKVAPEPGYWPHFWNKGCAIRWDGFSDEELAALQVPVLVALGDHDFVRAEHAVAAFRRIPGAELAILPDAGHFALDSEPERLLAVVEHFLTKPARRPPIATASLGYRPGETR